MNDSVTPTIANQDSNPTYSKSQELPSELTEDFFRARLKTLVLLRW